VDAVTYFFFQAEDGIRDFHVTGVQTCALPISGADPPDVTEHTGGLKTTRRHDRALDDGELCFHRLSPRCVPLREASQSQSLVGRSEERRVGKECRGVWAPCYR